MLRYQYAKIIKKTKIKAKIKAQTRIEKRKNIFTKSNNRVSDNDNNSNHEDKGLSFSNVKRTKIITRDVMKIRKKMSRTKTSAKKNPKTKIKKDKTL